MNTDLSDFQDLYFKTAKEYVSILAEKVDTIKESHTPEILEEVHRAAHSLKSQSAVMGISSIADLSGELERIFQEVINNAIGLTDDLVAALQSAVSTLDRAVETVQQTGTEPDLSADIEKLQQLK